MPTRSSDSKSISGARRAKSSPVSNNSTTSTSLSGKKIVVVANLEKAELFGVESNGMVLAAGEEADLLTTHADAEPGTKIK